MCFECAGWSGFPRQRILKFQDFPSIESLIIAARRKAVGEPIHQRYEMAQVIQGLISSHHFSHNREASGQTLRSFEHLQRFLCLINTNYMNKSIGIVNHTVLYILFLSPSPGETEHKEAEKLS